MEKSGAGDGNRTHVTPIINGSFGIPKRSDRSISVFTVGIGENGGIEMILL